jgi:hypothetical protein
MKSERMRSRHTHCWTSGLSMRERIDRTTDITAMSALYKTSSFLVGRSAVFSYELFSTVQ